MTIVQSILSILLSILRTLFSLLALFFNCIYEGMKYMVNEHPEFVIGFSTATAIAISLSILSFSCAPDSSDDVFVNEYYVDAIRAVNGRTILIKRAILLRDRIYLSGIETPAIEAPFGDEARRALNKLVAGQRIFVKQIKGEPDDCGVVYNEYGQCVQQQLVKEGLARCTGKWWKSEEEQARKNKRGVWSLKNVDAVFKRPET